MSEQNEDAVVEKSYLELLEEHICDLATNHDEHTVNTTTHIERLLSWIAQQLKRQVTCGLNSGEDHRILLDRYQTLVLDMGRQGGGVMLTQMLANEKALVFDAAKASNVRSSRPLGVPAIDEAVYAPLKKAKIIEGDAAAFLHELNTDQYEAVIIFGTRALSCNIGEGTTIEFDTKSFREQLYYLGKRDKLKHVLVIG